MTASSVKLYTAEVLELATSLASWPLDPAMPYQGRARSQSCGSTLTMSLQTGDDGRVAAIGIAAQACAIGQASAAIFANAAYGRTRDEIAAAEAAVAKWLKGECSQPDWPGLAKLAAAKNYPARHPAMMLAWRAALDGLPTTGLPS